MPDDTNFNMSSGMTDDFTNIINDDIGVTISYTPVVTTQRGTNTVRTDGTAANRTAMIFLKGRSYKGLDEGFFEDADVVMLGKSTETYTRDSKVSFGNETYLVKNYTESFIYGNVLVSKIDLVKT